MLWLWWHRIKRLVERYFGRRREAIVESERLAVKQALAYGGKNQVHFVPKKLLECMVYGSQYSLWRATAVLCG